MKYFILTGASRGIGEAIARKLLSSDSHLLCVSRTKNSSLIASAKTSNHGLDYFEADLGKTHAIDELVRNIFKRINPSKAEALYLINNAGIAQSRYVEEWDATSVTELMNINLIAPIVLTSCFIKYSQELNIEKRILNVSSGSSFNLYPGGSCYSTSKAGLETFTKSVGIENKDVKIMGVRPGMVDTLMHASTTNKKLLKTPDYAADRIITFLMNRFEHGKVVKAW